MKTQDTENEKKALDLNFFQVALMYVGTVMGAGFASGREIWQFFGVFGKSAYTGVLLIGILFIIMGMMASYNARALGTSDMGKVIVPGGNSRLISFVGYFMAIMLFTVLITMTAAGGALFHQTFGLHRAAGGLLIAALVIVTVLGEFERVSQVFRFIMPILSLAGACLFIYAAIAKHGIKNVGFIIVAIVIMIVGAIYHNPKSAKKKLKQ